MSNEENGFLTERDRAFLQAGGDYYTGENAKNQRYETREVIAERARQAFHDFALLNDVLNNRERNRVFDPPERESLDEPLWNTVAFLYLCLEGEAGSSPRYTGDRSYTGRFENILKTGVQRGEARRHSDDFAGVVTVEFDVNVSPGLESVDVERAIQAIAADRVNDADEHDLRALVSLATNPTDRLRELADLVEEARDGDRYQPHELNPHDTERMAEEAPTLWEYLDGVDVGGDRE